MGNHLTAFLLAMIFKVFDIVIKYKEHLSSGSMQNFWISYLEMVQLLLKLIYAQRAGHWHLHLESLKKLIPWGFAYDRLITQPYLSDILNLPSQHPEIYKFFMSGNFSVQLSEDNSLGRSDAADNTIENTINKEMKHQVKLRRFSTHRAAVDRWNLNARRKAVFRAVLNKHVEYKSSRYVHHNLLPGWIKRDERDVSHIIESIECSFINPFGEKSELMVILSGVKATEEIKDHLLSAESYSKSAMDEFVKKDLSEKPIQDFFDPIKKRSLKTFASLMPKSLVRVNPISTGGSVFHLQPSKWLRTPKRNKPLP